MDKSEHSNSFEDSDWTALKLAINEAIWTKAPGSTTLLEAEESACLAISHLFKCFEQKKQKQLSS